MNKTNYKQQDSRWGGLVYPKKPCYIRNVGCGEVSIANILIEMEQYAKYTPATIQPYCKRYGAPNCDGTYLTGICAMMKHYGFTDVKECDTMAELWKELEKGDRVAVYLMGSRPGGSKGIHWTSGGHFIASVGYKNKDGKHYLYIKDPWTNDKNRNGWLTYEEHMKNDIIQVSVGKLVGAKASAPDGKLVVDGIGGEETVKAMQKLFGTNESGIISGQLKKINKYYPSLVAVDYDKKGSGSPCIKKLQKWLGLTEDGVIGQGTTAAWQKKLRDLGYLAKDEKIDGYFGVKSMTAWQKFLNDHDKLPSDPDKGTDTTKKKTHKVIDISNFQGTSDFAKVKADGIKGVIVKCGYRGAEDGKLKEDSRFLEHIRNAHKAGLAVGIYMFTQAVTATEAKDEADYAVKMWKKADVPISYPIAIDTESVVISGRGGRANGLTKAQRTTVIKAFCERIKELGYEPMIYASTSWLNNKLNMEKLPYKVWVAQYASKCEYKGEYVMWQYTSDGNVKGIDGRVDMNKCYIEPKEVPCPRKTVTELAKEVIDGKWGSGDERKKRLEAEGYDYDAVQSKVNEILEAEKTNGQKIADMAVKLAYSTNTAKASYVNGEPKKAYKEAIPKAYPNRSGWGKPARDGASCDVAAGVSIRMAGVDPNFPRGLSPSYLAKSDKFELVKVTADTIKDGDIIITDKHICIHVGGKIKEASHPHYNEKTKKYEGGFYPKTTDTLKKRLSAKGAKVYRAK